jgi:hypothetical protein
MKSVCLTAGEDIDSIANGPFSKFSSARTTKTTSQRINTARQWQNRVSHKSKFPPLPSFTMAMSELAHLNNGLPAVEEADNIFRDRDAIFTQLGPFRKVQQPVRHSARCAVGNRQLISISGSRASHRCNDSHSSKGVCIRIPSRACHGALWDINYYATSSVSPRHSSCPSSVFGGQAKGRAQPQKARCKYSAPFLGSPSSTLA